MARHLAHRTHTAGLTKGSSGVATPNTLGRTAADCTSRGLVETNSFLFVFICGAFSFYHSVDKSCAANLACCGTTALPNMHKRSFANLYSPRAANQRGGSGRPELKRSPMRSAGQLTLGQRAETLGTSGVTASAKGVHADSPRLARKNQRLRS